MIKPLVNIENITLYLPYNLGGVEMSKSANNVLSSFCYFSVFFMPFLFPLIVWILASGDTSKHAGKALLYHILPIFFMLIWKILIEFGKASLMATKNLIYEQKYLLSYKN